MMHCMLLCMLEVLEALEVLEFVVEVVLKVIDVAPKVLRGCAEGGGDCAEGA